MLSKDDLLVIQDCMVLAMENPATRKDKILDAMKNLHVEFFRYGISDQIVMGYSNFSDPQDYFEAIKNRADILPNQFILRDGDYARVICSQSHYSWRRKRMPINIDIHRNKLTISAALNTDFYTTCELLNGEWRILFSDPENEDYIKTFPIPEKLMEDVDVTK